MNAWLTIQDMRKYLQISESKIRYLIKIRQIPYHDNHGFLRFNRQEIDEWMKAPVTSDEAFSQKTEGLLYRDRPIKNYALTSHKILIGRKPWNRLSDFIKSYVARVNEIKIHDDGREYLYRKEFGIFSNNFNDYLRVSCQLGLIRKKQGAGKEKHYFPTDYAVRIHAAKDHKAIQEIILESILHIVKKKRETLPDERHALLLLWYILSLKAGGIALTTGHFAKNTSELKTYIPLIRLNFSKSLLQFLFDSDRKKEEHFLAEWNRLVAGVEKTSGQRETGAKLTLFGE
jgi:excisionase family DNA binding protein